MRGCLCESGADHVRVRESSHESRERRGTSGADRREVGDDVHLICGAGARPGRRALAVFEWSGVALLTDCTALPYMAPPIAAGPITHGAWAGHLRGGARGGVG